MMVNHKHQASGEMDIGVTEARVPKIGQVKQLYSIQKWWQSILDHHMFIDFQHFSTSCTSFGQHFNTDMEAMEPGPFVAGSQSIRFGPRK